VSWGLQSMSSNRVSRLQPCRGRNSSAQEELITEIDASANALVAMP
jgi:hypothetical protein